MPIMRVAEELCDATRDLLVAYERLVRSHCTPEQIEKQPWRCREFVAAESILTEAERQDEARKAMNERIKPGFPLEPEPPKAEPEPLSKLKYCESCKGTGRNPGTYPCGDCNETGLQPKADTGTLEALEQAAADAELYGHLYARDALRDALTELRRMREQRATDQRIHERELDDARAERDAYKRNASLASRKRIEELEARASSPDLSALVEKANAFIEAAEEYRCASVVNMASDTEATAIEVRMLEARNVLRDRLEASGEQK